MRLQVPIGRFLCPAGFAAVFCCPCSNICAGRRSTRARDNLERVSWQVDCIVTHCAPTSVHDKLGRGAFQADHLTEFLEEVAQRCRFRHWFFGHYHMDGHLGESFRYLYQELLQLTQTHS